eukprot:5438572-Amphidinium_carterae.1
MSETIPKRPVSLSASLLTSSKRKIDTSMKFKLCSDRREGSEGQISDHILKLQRVQDYLDLFRYPQGQSVAIHIGANLRGQYHYRTLLLPK